MFCVTSTGSGMLLRAPDPSYLKARRWPNAYLHFTLSLPHRNSLHSPSQLKKQRDNNFLFSHNLCWLLTVNPKWQEMDPRGRGSGCAQRCWCLGLNLRKDESRPDPCLFLQYKTLYQQESTQENTMWHDTLMCRINILTKKKVYTIVYILYTKSIYTFSLYILMLLMKVLSVERAGLVSF